MRLLTAVEYHASCRNGHDFKGENKRAEAGRESHNIRSLMAGPVTGYSADVIIRCKQHHVARDVGSARTRQAESAGLESSFDPQLPKAGRSSATRGNGRAEQSDGDRMSRSGAMMALVMVGAALALTSCARDRPGDRSDVAGWRHRDGSAVSDLEFGQARAACSQTAMAQNPESAPFDTTMDPARGRAFLNALPPSPSSTPNDAAQFVECLDSKEIVPAP